MKCPQCKEEMEKVKYDIGSGILTDSLTCPHCKFNITDARILEEAIKEDIEWGLRKRKASKS